MVNAKDEDVSVLDRLVMISPDTDTDLYCAVQDFVESLN